MGTKHVSTEHVIFHQYQAAIRIANALEYNIPTISNLDLFFTRTTILIIIIILCK